MPYTVSLYTIENLAKGDAKNEILIATKLNTELHLTVKEDKTIISLPFGNKFEIVDNLIVVYES